MESNIRVYLEDLESELMFGKCAGKNAYISKLYQNKVEDKNQRVLNFERLRLCLESVSYTHLTLPTTPYV